MAQWPPRSRRNYGNRSSFGCSVPEDEAGGGFASEGHFGSVDAIYARFSTGGAAGRYNYVAGEEAQFHEAASDVFGEIEAIESTGFTLAELSKGFGGDWGI